MKSKKLPTKTQKKIARKKRGVVNVVVFVYRGIIDTVEVYRDEKTALARADFFKQDYNPDYDEVGVFEVEVGVPSNQLSTV